MYLLGVIVLFHLRRWNQLIMSDLNIVTQYIIAFPVWVTCHTGISCGDMPWQYSYMLYGTCNTMFDTVYGIWFIILFTFGYMFYILYSSLSISTKLRSCAIYFDDSLFFCSCQPPEINACVGTQAVPTGVNSHERLSDSTRCNTWGFSFCPWPTAKRFVGDFQFSSQGKWKLQGGPILFPKRKDCGVDTSGT